MEPSGPVLEEEGEDPEYEVEKILGKDSQGNTSLSGRDTATSGINLWLQETSFHLN